MAKQPRENRIPIMMSDEEVEAVDDWRYAHRVATRSDAVRRMIRMALIYDDVRDDLLKALKEETRATAQFQKTMAEFLESEFEGESLENHPRRKLFSDLIDFVQSNTAMSIAVSSLVRPLNAMRESGELDNVVKGAVETKEFFVENLRSFRRDDKTEG